MEQGKPIFMGELLFPAISGASKPSPEQIKGMFSSAHLNGFSIRTFILFEFFNKNI
jgi:hypothetical protein